MKKEMIVLTAVITLVFCSDAVFAQYHDYLAFDRFVADPLYPGFLSRGDFHTGIHSGSWTLKREQIFEAESKDKFRSCCDLYCNRCSKHLADYGHEYQYVCGPGQQQIWYRGTAGTIAPVRQYGYDEHGHPYAHRGQPAAVMSKEYVRVLNHAIWEQIQARNAVADEEAAEDRVGLLSELRDAASAQLAQSQEAWGNIKHSGHCLRYGLSSTPCSCAKTYENNNTENIAASCVPYGSRRFWGLCEYCAAKAQFCFDQAYVADVEKELSCAIRELEFRTAIADEAVRIALLSKPDADRATRFKRIQMKPPKYQEVLAAKEVKEAAEKKPEESSQ